MLDAGCGTGRLLQLLTAHGAVEGCDASSVALRYCRRRGITDVVRSDLNNADLGRDRYDVITSIDVLYHQGIKNDRLVVKKMHDALKPGGILVLQVPAYEWLRSEHDIAVHTGRRYTKTQVMRMLKACGFSIETATYRLAFLFVPIVLVRLARNLFSYRRSGAGAASDVKKHAGVVNALLLAVMKVENRLLKRVSLPFGTSVFTVARKPGASLEKKG
jgi:SAM-dependent methyltransferase